MSMEDSDFGFAFNNVNFSDRLLRIEITRSSDVVGFSRDRKRRREDDNNHTNVATSHVESDLNKNSCETNHKEALVKAEQEPQSGGDNCGLTNNTSVLKVKELHISSAILAAKSPFFYKLFSNGMLESEQSHMTLKIDASEENAVMELLKFMYSNSLSSVMTHSALLDVLMVADKFEVASCMKYCSQWLLKMSMTVESALLLLNLPASLLMADSVKPLTNAARQFIAFRYKELFKISMEELMALPLVGVEAILASDGLEIPSEDCVYEVVLRWVKLHYSVLEERQEILSSHLARYIRFPHLTCGQLMKILTSNDFKPYVAARLVLEALFFKAESLDYQRFLAYEQPSSIYHRFAERAYIYRPIKLVKFEVPRQQCIVYLDLKRKECESIYPSSRITSQMFPLGGQGFFLSAHCNMDHLGLFHSFGLFLGMQETGSSSMSVNVDYEFSVRSKPTMEFVGKFKGNGKFTGGKAIGSRNLFLVPWNNFTAKDFPYFINDVLHLRADLTIRL